MNIFDWFSVTISVLSEKLKIALRRTRQHIGRCTKNLHPENDGSSRLFLHLWGC